MKACVTGLNAAGAGGSTTVSFFGKHGVYCRSGRAYNHALYSTDGMSASVGSMNANVSGACAKSPMQYRAAFVNSP